MHLTLDVSEYFEMVGGGRKGKEYLFRLHDMQDSCGFGRSLAALDEGMSGIPDTVRDGFNEVE